MWSWRWLQGMANVLMQVPNLQGRSTTHNQVLRLWRSFQRYYIGTPDAFGVVLMFLARRAELR